MGDGVLKVLDCLWTAGCWASTSLSFFCLLLLLPCLWIHSLHLSFVCLSVCLAISGVRQRHLAAEHLPVQWWETVGGLRVDQTEKLQFIDVEVTDRLHCGQHWHHLCGQRRYWGQFLCCVHNCMYLSGVVTVCPLPCPVSHQKRCSSVDCAAEPGRLSPGVSEPFGLLSARADLYGRKY